MKKKWKRLLRPALFTAGGALAGLAFYWLARCSAGTCVITSSPWVMMAYMGVAGGLLSAATETGCRDKCNM